MLLPESYLSKDVKCPYYRKDIQNKICCEGIDYDGTIHLNFTSLKKRTVYEKSVCCGNYKLCPIAQVLDKKWGED